MVSSEELIGVILPTVLGVAMVLATVATVFWLGSGKKRSYEEAKAQASRKAEEALREKEKEKEKTSPKPKKGRKNFRRKKESQEDADTTLPRKGILKAPAAGVEMATPERPSPKVEFKLDTMAKEDGARRANPTTPYPNKDATLGVRPATVVRTPQPIFEEEEEEEEEEEVEEKVEPVKQAEPKKLEAAATKKKQEVAEKPPVKAAPPSQKPSQNPTQATQKPPQAAPQRNPQALSGKPEPAEQVVVPKAAQKRSKGNKTKLVIGSGMDSHDAMPASRIEDILTASSLSDEEIQPLIALLLEKSNANSEWEAPNLKIESNKSLKRQNQELQSRLEEATQSSVSLSSKIKELRREVQTEKNKHQTAEITLQSKLNQQAKDLAIFRARSSGLEEEMKRMKALMETQRLQKLREENSLLSTQVAQLQQQQAAQLQTGMTSSVPGVGMREKVAEQEKLLEHKAREIEQLTASGHRLQAQLQSVNEVCSERDELKQRVSQLESSHAQLTSEAQKASSAKEDGLAHIGALQEDLKKVQSAAAQEKAELQHQHQAELEGVRRDLAEVERLRESAARSQEQSKELEDRNQQLAELEDRTKQLAELEERNKKLVLLEEESKQLAVQEGSKAAELEEKVKKLEVQLETEQASKKDLMSELDRQAKEAKALSNGPVQTTLSNGGPDDQSTPDAGGAKEVAILEKKLEDLKSKNDELNESLWQTKQDAGEAENVWEEKLKQVQQQMEQGVSSAKAEAFLEAYENHRALLRQLFPEVSVVGVADDGQQEKWLEEFEGKAQAILKNTEEESTFLKEKVCDLEKQKEENSREILNFRQTLEKTFSILADLQQKVDTGNREHELKLKEKEVVLEREISSNKHLQGELSQEQSLVSQVRKDLDREKALATKAKEDLSKVQEELTKEKEAVSRLQEELETSRAEGGGAEDEAVAKLEERLQQLEQSRTSMEKQVAELQGELKEKEEAREALEQCVAAESKLKEDAIKKSDELEVEKKDVAERLEVMKQSNRDLNARLSSLIVSSPTDSEV